MADFPKWKVVMLLLVCVFFIAAALPNLFSQQQLEDYPDWLPREKVNLGLDLRGGAHLLLQLDFDAYLKEHYETLRDELRIAMREQKVGYRQLKAQADAVRFTVRPETLSEEAPLSELVAEIDPQLEVTAQGVDYVIQYDSMALVTKRRELLEQSIEIIGRRINETGTKEPTVQRQGDDRILVQVPGVDDPEQLKDIMGKTAKMTFHLVNEAVMQEQIRRGIMPAKTELLASDNPDMRLPDGSAVRYPIFTRVALSGELLTGANPGYQDGQPVVEFSFNPVGARKFGEITSKNIGKRFAVVLDGKVITAPVIRGAILGGRGVIEGNFDVNSANELAILLRAGALPAPLTFIEERSVGPSLGADSVAAGEMAVLIAIAAVMVFMLLYYGLFGVFSNIALLMNIVLILGTLSLLQATLTLPGIAGIVLTMGMAVDANTLIFERIREEWRLGKSVRASIDQGFRTAFGTIIDSNITTLIAAFILFYFGSGSVKGFAVTLSIGILASLFSAILLTRLMMLTWFQRVRPTTLPL